MPESPAQQIPHPEFDAIRTLIKDGDPKEDDKQSYSAVAKKTAAKAAASVPKTTPSTPKAATQSSTNPSATSAPATPKSGSGFYNFLKR